MPRRLPDSRPGRLGLQARYRAEAALFDVLSLAARLAPTRVRFAVGAGLGALVWALDGRHRHVARDNVQLAYGDAMGAREVRRLVRRSMQHFGKLTVETLAFRRYLTETVDAQVKVEGFERLRLALARGRGVIGITGHLGHWELLVFMSGRLGIPVTSMARPLDNPYLEARLTDLRTLSGNSVINKRGAFPEALAVLRQGRLLGVVIDQRPKRGGIQVPFFGTNAYTTDGLARLALASEAAVMPCFTVQEPDGSWRMVIEPEVPVVRTGDVEADQYRITADCTAVLEQWVRRYPDQWLWTHRRWAVPREGTPSSPRAGSSHVT